MIDYGARKMYHKTENNWKQQYLHYANTKPIPDQVIPITIFPTTTIQTTTISPILTIVNTIPNTVDKPSNTIKIVIQTQTTNQNSSNNNIFIIEILNITQPALPLATNIILGLYSNQQQLLPQSQILDLAKQLQQRDLNNKGKGKSKQKRHAPVIGTGIPTKPEQRYNYYTASGVETSDYPTDP
ncbi:11743_t:CDS:2, partial [Racocetra fulgida]